MGKRLAVAALVLFAVASTIWYATGDASTPPVGSGHELADPKAGLSVVTPPGWRTSISIEPVQVVARFGKTGFISEEDGCDESDYTIVWLTIREGDATPLLPVIPRPAHFTASDGSGIQSGSADESCELRSQAIPFTDDGRKFFANLTFGRDAPQSRIEQAYAILNSLEVSKAAPSPWKSFCRAAEQLDLSRKDLASDSRFPEQLHAMREASPSSGVADALRRVEPVATNPTASLTDAVAVEDDLRTVGNVLAQHCNQPITYFRWLYLGNR